MKIFRFTPILLILFIAGWSCSPNPRNSFPDNNALSQTPFVPTDNGYKLVWMDSFDGTKLDTTKWSLRGLGSRRIGYNDSSMVKMENGNLLLMYDIKGDSILGAMIGSEGKFETTYGYFECRAELQKSVGPWAAFWMQSPKISEGTDPAEYGVEMDIFEYFNELGPDTLSHALHWAYGPEMQSVGPLKSGLKGLDKGFHTFGFEWTEKNYAFYIDGLKFFEVNEGISKIDQYIILSMEIRDKLEGFKKAVAPDTFKIDYVKVYKK
ncbi:glycoside hydrolase family 16 protein [Macellibacteroides fermentans]|uniref:Beta-glucanase, GH16 family n=1 Tax=Parabacteroides chartae TaxID=1037355 RepID=A0A1T5ART1_9BACT|nr:glycoside hydrolase family 16 protein [Parabacteroides chartae]SKB37698.1 Beta-glucanase, GH16 family [Parabacteroides chartae]